MPDDVHIETERPPSDDLLFETSELDKALINLLAKSTSATKWPMFNAVRHLNRAWKIRADDAEMALFRSITAEEEAVTSLFQSLKSHQYAGAEKLKSRNHLQKNAVLPFFDALTRVLSKIHDPPPLQVRLNGSSNATGLIIEFQLALPGVGMRWVRAVPPLHFIGRRSVDGGQTYRIDDFSQGISEVVTRANVASIAEHLRERANARNRLLYASAGGYPEFRGNTERHLLNYQRNVLTLLRMYFLIDPYPKVQNFVQQALLSFLKMLEVFEGDLESAFE